MVLVALLIPAGVSAVNTVSAFADLYTERADTVALPPKADKAAHDPAKPTIAFLTNGGGTNVADTLGPYEVLASTGKINTYVVSPGERPPPVCGRSISIAPRSSPSTR